MVAPYASGKTTSIAALLNKDFKGYLITTVPNLEVTKSLLKPGKEDNIIGVQLLEENVEYDANGKIVIANPTTYSQINNLSKHGPNKSWKDLDNKCFISLDDCTAFADDIDSPVMLEARSQLKLNTTDFQTNARNIQRTVGLAQNIAMSILNRFLHKHQKPWHFICACHLRRLTIDVARIVDDNELKNAAKSASLDTSDRNDVNSVQLQSSLKYPIICGQAPSEKFPRSFSWILQPYLGTNKPMVRFKDSIDTTLRSMGCDFKIKDAEEALPWVLNYTNGVK